jgi:hypothetical protein
MHEVRRGKHSLMTSVAFDYRIVAHRKGYENIRLADLTDQFNNASRQARAKHVCSPCEAGAACEALQSCLFTTSSCLLQPPRPGFF